MKNGLFIIFECAALIVSSAAQEVSKVQVFGGYSLAHMAPCGTQGGGCNVQESETPEANNFNGWNMSVTSTAWKGLGLTADFSGYYGTVQFGSRMTRHASIYDILFGPTWTFTQGRIAPFVHGLAGVQHVARSPSEDESGTQYGTGLAWVLGGGLDVSLSRHLSARIGQLDYLRGRIPQNYVPNGDYSNGFRYSGGIVLRF